MFWWVYDLPLGLNSKMFLMCEAFDVWSALLWRALNIKSVLGIIVAFAFRFNYQKVIKDITVVYITISEVATYHFL